MNSAFTKGYSVTQFEYVAFVEKIDFKKELFCIINKDHKAYHNHIDNYSGTTAAVAKTALLQLLTPLLVQEVTLTQSKDSHLGA